MKTAFAELFDDELAQWLLTEVAHNDTHTIRQQKRCADPPSERSDCFSDQSFDQPWVFIRYGDTPARKTTTDWVTEVPFARDGAEIDGHNMHGTPSFLKLLRTRETAFQQTFFHCEPAADGV
jgi:hypothetical protein